MSDHKEMPPGSVTGQFIQSTVCQTQRLDPDADDRQSRLRSMIYLRNNSVKGQNQNISPAGKYAQNPGIQKHRDKKTIGILEQRH